MLLMLFSCEERNHGKNPHQRSEIFWHRRRRLHHAMNYDGVRIASDNSGMKN